MNPVNIPKPWVFEINCNVKLLYVKEPTILFDSKKYLGHGSENNPRESIPNHPVVARKLSVKNISTLVSTAVCKFVSILDVLWCEEQN
jgi:hypothetical protein